MLTTHHRREELNSRLILFGLILLILALILLVGWYLWDGRLVTTKFQPKPTDLIERLDAQIISTACFEAYLPKDFEVNEGLDCRVGAYARSRKYSYFQVSPYYNVDNEGAMLARWRERWLTLGGEERSKDRVIIDGRPAWRLEEYYPQNQESFVTYLFFLDGGLRVDGTDLVRALELRGWVTTDIDRKLMTDIIQDWRWRF